MSNETVWLLPILPALGALLNGLVLTKAPRKVTAAVAIGAMALSLALALKLAWWMFAAMPGERVLAAPLYNWLSVGDFHIRVGLLLDPLAMVMVLVVLAIGTLIHIYAADYMKEDGSYRRFFVYLNLFVFFMLILVLADNLVVTFVGWEGVGLCSYLLIGFWYEKKSACDAGRKAFVVNRIGDFGFMLGILLLAVTFGTADYRELSAAAAGSGAAESAILWACLLLFMGAMGKSAQFPFHVWLPDAMEGPTPVSALIHAATMVNAGVYLMCRISFLLERVPEVLAVIAAVGLVTAVYAALSALGQRDIKRVLAYSTVSQIGFMFVAVGCGLYAAGMFHLVTHGVFKCLLFLGAGAVIHALHGEQDLGRMGGLLRDLPSVSIAFAIGLLALAGVFPLAGFISKDAILWGGYEHNGLFFWLAAFLGALITAAYAGRLWLAFLGERRHEAHLHRSGPAVTATLMILAVSALAVGVPGLPLFTQETHFARFVGTALPQAAAAEGEYLMEIVFTIGQSVAVLSVIAAVLYIMIYKRARLRAVMDRGRSAMALLASGFLVDRVYDAVFVTPTRKIAQYSARVVDADVIDGAVNGLGYLAMALGRFWTGLQTGVVRTYAVSIIVGVFAAMGVCLYVAGGF